MKNSAVAWWLFFTCVGYLWTGTLRGAVWGLCVATGCTLVAAFIALYREDG